MACVGKSAFFFLSASDCKGTGQILCQVPQAIFPFLFFFLNTSTPREQNLCQKEEGRGMQKRSSVFTL